MNKTKEITLQDVKVWSVTFDHKARPKNPYHKLHQIEWCVGKWETLSEWTDFETFAIQHIYACSPTLIAGDYPDEMFELVWQYSPNDGRSWEFEMDEETHRDSLNIGLLTRQYLQLKQPVKEQTSNERNIEECIREYEANKLLKPFLIDADIFKGMSKHFHVAIKKDVNGYCISCHKEPCACHLIPLI